MRSKRLFRRFKVAALCVFAGAIWSQTGAQAQALPTSSPMPIGAPTFAPKGFVQFCERRPDQCGLPSPMPYGERMALEQMLNRQQWANIFGLEPMSIPAPAASDASSPRQTPEETTAFQDGGALDVVTSDPVDPPLRPALDRPAVSEAESSPLPQPAQTPVVAGVPVVVATPSVIAMNAWTWGELNRINRSINDRIRPMTDEQAFGMSDFWTLPLSDGPRAVGNCKHYALEKRKALVEAGAPMSALSIAILRTDRGEVHAVLIVATERGDFVLDNLTSEIRGWREPDYAWLSRQVPGRPLEWAVVGEPVGRRLYF
jgi:predicted transglutaminase-like cysteine proteinase